MGRFSIMVTEYGSGHEVLLCNVNANPQRIVDALAELHVAHRRGTVVVVSHGDLIRAALLFALGMPLDLHARIEIELASISTIEFGDSGCRVRQLNECPRR